MNASTEDLREVLGHLPEPLARLPKHLRWMLGREIRQRLESGWRPDQILDVLAAPMPVHVERPWRLALWRLRHNIVGSGPRLRPLQQAWDAQTSAASRAAAEDTTARWYGDVAAVTTAEQRAELLRADEVKFGRRAKDPVGQFDSRLGRQKSARPSPWPPTSHSLPGQRHSRTRDCALRLLTG